MPIQDPGDAVPGELITATWGDKTRASILALDTEKVAKAGDSMGAGANLIFPTGPVRIEDSPGRIFVGKAASSADTVGTELLTGGSILATINAAGSANLIATHIGGASANTQEFARFRATTTVCGSITQSGTTGTNYNVSSDYRLKDEVGPIDGAAGRVAALRPIRYTWKADPDLGVQEGFLAHEVAEVAPYAVTGDKDAVADGAIVPQQLDLSKLVTLLTAAVQELTARVEALEP